MLDTLMLWELSVTEQRYRAVPEELSRYGIEARSWQLWSASAWILSRRTVRRSHLT